jgi:hypothetical protein
MEVISLDQLNDPSSTRITTAEAMINEEYNNVSEILEETREATITRETALNSIHEINKQRERDGKDPLTDQERIDILRSYLPSAKDLLTRAAERDRERREERERQKAEEAKETGTGIQVKVMRRCGCQDHIVLSAKVAANKILRQSEIIKASNFSCRTCNDNYWEQQLDEWEATMVLEPLIGKTPKQIKMGRNVRKQVVEAFQQTMANIADGDAVIHEQLMAYQERALNWHLAETWCDALANLQDGQVLMAIAIPAEWYTVENDLAPLTDFTS